MKKIAGMMLFLCALLFAACDIQTAAEKAEESCKEDAAMTLTLCMLTSTSSTNSNCMYMAMVKFGACQ